LFKVTSPDEKTRPPPIATSDKESIEKGSIFRILGSKSSFAGVAQPDRLTTVIFYMVETTNLAPNTASLL